MKKQTKKILTTLCLACLLLGCGAKENGKEVAEADGAMEDSSAVSNMDVMPEEVKEPELTIGNESLDRQIEAVKEQFKDVPNPVELYYEGFEFGDYPHIIFTDGKEGMYDFGDGSNNFGEYENGIMDEEASEYAGKKFKVYWDWKVSSFSCCEGNMDAVTAKVPSITKLELIE